MLVMQWLGLLRNDETKRDSCGMRKEYTTFVTLEASHTMLVMQWLRFLWNDKGNEKQIGIGIPTE
jgi:hypothetical protein